MNQTSPLDNNREVIEQWISEGKSHREIAGLLESHNVQTSERSIRRAMRRWGHHSRQHGPQFEKAGARINGDDAEVVSDPRAWKSYLNDTNALLKERGLDPDEWEIHSLVANEWDSPTGETLKQLKVHLKRKKILSMVVPARVPLGRSWQPVNHIRIEDDPELVVFVGDQHAPHHDPELHKRFCDFLNDQQPERGVLVGDTLDLPTISRHAPEPDWAPSTQECVDAGGQVILDYRNASETTRWVKLPGNHDERLRRAIIDRLGDWYGLKPAQVENLPDLPPIYDPVHLLRLDELGIEYLRPKGSYDYAQYMVSPYLAARHGWLARKGAGSSALATLDHLGHSVVVGHTHRQSLVHQTKHDIHGKPTVRAAAEIGCMCLIEDGLGYAPAPDWQQGFSTASLFSDGTFKLDLGTFVNGNLYWRSEKY